MIGGALLFGAALYIGVPLTNDAPVAVERYATREEIPGGEQDDRWKTTWLLLRLVPATDGPVRLGDPSAPPGSWRESGRYIRAAVRKGFRGSAAATTGPGRP